jgi:hypothetical protein
MRQRITLSVSEEEERKEAEKTTKQREIERVRDQSQREPET